MSELMDFNKKRNQDHRIKHRDLQLKEYEIWRYLKERKITDVASEIMFPFVFKNGILFRTHVTVFCYATTHTKNRLRLAYSEAKYNDLIGLALAEKAIAPKHRREEIIQYLYELIEVERKGRSPKLGIFTRFWHWFSDLFVARFKQ